VKHYTDALITYLDAAGAIPPVPRDEAGKPIRTEIVRLSAASLGLVAWPPRSQSMRTSGPKARGKKGTSLGEAYARRRISIHRCSKVHGPTPARATPQRALSCAWRPFMQDPVYVLPRISIPRTSVNKGLLVCLRAFR
jgi:hypothetical protein